MFLEKHRGSYEFLEGTSRQLVPFLFLCYYFGRIHIRE